MKAHEMRDLSLTELEARLEDEKEIFTSTKLLRARLKILQELKTHVGKLPD